MADFTKTAFVVEDAAGRWDKAMAFSSKCTIAMDPTHACFVVQHQDHALDPSWRIIFPVFSAIKRLAPCQPCQRRPDTLCDNGFPCVSCQHHGTPCRPNHVRLVQSAAVDGEAEMEKAAEESSLIARSGQFQRPLMYPLVVHEGYVPKPVTPPSTPTHSAPLPSTSTPTHSTPPRRPVRHRLRRLVGIAEPVSPSCPKLTAAERLGRVHQLLAMGKSKSGPVIGYSMKNDQAPPWVDLGGLEITMAEMAVFLLNLAHRPEGAMRIVDNGWTPSHYCNYHNWAHGYKGETRRRGDKSEGAIRSTFTKSLQRIMRIATADNLWTQSSHHMEPTPELSTAAWLPLTEDPPTHSLRAMGRHVTRWPPESHSLNLTRAVRYALEHPDIPDDQLQFPTHVRSIVEKLPGGFRCRALEASPDDNLNQTILHEWIDYQDC